MCADDNNEADGTSGALRCSTHQVLSETGSRSMPKRRCNSSVAKPFAIAWASRPAFSNAVSPAALASRRAVLLIDDYHLAGAATSSRCACSQFAPLHPPAAARANHLCPSSNQRGRPAICQHAAGANRIGTAGPTFAAVKTLR